MLASNAESRQPWRGATELSDVTSHSKNAQFIVLASSALSLLKVALK